MFTSLFVTALFVYGFYFLKMPENAYSGILANLVPSCCQDDVEKSCFGGENVLLICESKECIAHDCTYFEDKICVSQNDVRVCVPQSRDVPAMNKWGIIALAVVLAVIAFIAFRRRKINA